MRAGIHRVNLKLCQTKCYLMGETLAVPLEKLVHGWGAFIALMTEIVRKKEKSLDNYGKGLRC